MSISRYDLFKHIIETIPNTSTIAVIGRMRSGKTTFALTFSQYIMKYYDKKYKISFQLYKPSDLENVNELENKIYYDSKDVNILIFDDLSFIVSGYNKAVRNFLNLITRIAHITLSDINYIFFIGHYSRAISPFLRASNVVVLTSISHPEISSLKELFTLSSLYDYLYYYENNPKRYIYLIRYHTYERIFDFTIETPNIEIPICNECLEVFEEKTSI
jgi:hypothetical protein